MATNEIMRQSIDFVPTQQTETRVCVMDSKGDELFNRLVPSDALTSFSALKHYLQDNDNRPLSFWEGVDAKMVLPGKTPITLNSDRDELKKGTFDGEEAYVIYTKTKDKRINSGSGERNEIVSKMKELHLEAKVKEVCGKNWTQVSNDKIQEVINKYGNQTEKTEPNKTVIDLGEEEKKEDTTKTIINETVENSEVVKMTKQVLEDMDKVAVHINNIIDSVAILKHIAAKYSGATTQEKKGNFSNIITNLNPFK